MQDFGTTMTVWSTYLTRWVSWSILTWKIWDDCSRGIGIFTDVTAQECTTIQANLDVIYIALIGIGTVEGSFYDGPFIIGVPIERSFDIQWKRRKLECALCNDEGRQRDPRHEYRKIQNVQMKDETG
jgi:hypothetical protein